jgi:hypothetical protein
MAIDLKLFSGGLKLDSTSSPWRVGNDRRGIGESFLEWHNRVYIDDGPCLQMNLESVEEPKLEYLLIY